MHGVALGRWGLVGVLLSLGCSSVSSPLARGRGPGSEQDGGASADGLGDDSDEAAPRPSSETTSGATSGAEPTTSTTPGGNRCDTVAPQPTPSSDSSSETKPSTNATGVSTSVDATSDVEPTPTVEGEHWVLVRSEDSELPFVEEWTYDDAARLVKARVVAVRRDVEPYYAVEITNTYDGDRVVSLHDRAPEELVDVTYEYELDAGLVVTYAESAGGEIYDSRTYSYDAEGRLIGSLESHYEEDEVWRLERQVTGVPSQLFKNEELACRYVWRHMWLGTTCYIDGVVSQVYEPDGADRVGSLRFDGNDTVQYYYDEADRLTMIRHPNTVFEYRYAADGKLLESLGPDYEELREYDEFGQLREVRWNSESGTSTTTFTYERRTQDEVIQTEVSDHRTVVRTYARLSHAPTREPELPSYSTVLRMVQPTVYMAPLDFSTVP